VNVYSHAITQSPVAVSFSKIVARAQLTSRDVALFDSHRFTIARAIENRLDFSKAEIIGSFARDTAIHGSSDVDLLVVLRKRSLTWGDSLKRSTTVLADVRLALQDRFPGTMVGKDGQAVVVGFNDGQHPVDVVPACYLQQGGPYNHPVYGIPDGAGGWLVTSPSSHNRLVAEADGRAGGKLKYAAQIFKYWRCTRSVVVPLSGFHAELLLAHEGVCEGARSYAEIFRDLLVILSNRGCSALNDPLDISGRIEAAATSAKRAQAVRTVDDSARHADAAVQAESAGNYREALRQWQMAFNDRFPG
jgi:predicted nucleotidyltransferase